MKNDNTAQMVQQPCQQTHAVEAEYINSMLNICCADTVRQDVLTDADKSHEENNNADIDCKVFKVSGLRLALPLSTVKDTLKQQKIMLTNTEDMKTDMCIGKINNNGDVINVIDLTSLIMNGIDNIDYLKTYETKLVDILLLKGSSLGIVCEEEIETQTISREHVCWRNDESDRAWLAGTVKQKGFSLLDKQGILSLLNNKY